MMTMNMRKLQDANLAIFFVAPLLCTPLSPRESRLYFIA